MFHAGFPGAGAGTPGGMGYRLENARPVPYIDDVAAEFPELNIISAHPAWPWHLENLAMVVAQGRTSTSTCRAGRRSTCRPRSSATPTRDPEGCCSARTGRCIDADRWIAEFDELGFKEESRRKILLDNAASCSASGSPE